MLAAHETRTLLFASLEHGAIHWKQMCLLSYETATFQRLNVTVLETANKEGLST